MAKFGFRPLLVTRETIVSGYCQFSCMGVDVPLAPSYVIYVSQLICFACVCNNVSDFASRNLVGCTTTCAISAYHHKRCEFESCSCMVYSIQNYVIKFVSDLRQVGDFLQVLRFPPPIKLTATI